MSTEKYLLHQNRIFKAIDDFFYDDCKLAHRIDTEIPDHKYIVRIAKSKEDLDVKKKPGQLNIFFASGKTSFSIQGNKEFETECRNCRDRIIEDTKITELQKIDRQIVFHNISTDLFNDFITYISSEENYSTESKGGDRDVVNRVVIRGPYATSITATYYHTNTLMLQGVLSTLLLDINTIAVGLFDKADKSNARAFMTLLVGPDVKLISDNLDDHLSNRAHLSATPYESLILTSLYLLNSSIQVPDYACMSFGALKALEGIIGLRISQSCAFSRNQLGQHFCETPSGSRIFALTTSAQATITSLPLRQALVDGYNHYHAHRHTTFHTDLTSPMDSVIITEKEDALDIVEKALRIINRILNNW